MKSVVAGLIDDRAMVIASGSHTRSDSKGTDIPVLIFLFVVEEPKVLSEKDRYNDDGIELFFIRRNGGFVTMDKSLSE